MEKYFIFNGASLDSNLPTSQFTAFSYTNLGARIIIFNNNAHCAYSKPGILFASVVFIKKRCNKITSESVVVKWTNSCSRLCVLRLVNSQVFCIMSVDFERTPVWWQYIVLFRRKLYHKENTFFGK